MTFKNKFTLSLFVLFIALTSRAQQATMLFIGDAMQHGPQLRSAYVSEGVYDYNSCYKYIAPFFSQADIVVANLEVPIGDPPYSGYPAFCAPKSYAEALKNAGINYMVTANNHSCDRSQKGIERTIDVLDTLRVIHTGTFKNAQERDKKYPLLIEKNGIKISLLNYTYGTNGIPIPNPNIVNLIDEEQIKVDVDSAKKQNPDIIIACMHWGEEYMQSPNAEQKRIASLLNSLGVKIIIGSHPHVVQPMFFNNDTLTAYSLGNFISNQRDLNTDGGSMIKFVLNKNETGVHISNVGYLLTWVYTPMENERKKYYVLPAALYENDTTFFGKDTAALKTLQRFTKNTRALFKSKNQNVSEMNYNCE